MHYSQTVRVKLFERSKILNIAKFWLIPLMLEISLAFSIDTTIQSAIDSSDSGSIINVPSGIYSESIDIDKSITLLCESGQSLMHLV